MSHFVSIVLAAVLMIALAPLPGGAQPQRPSPPSGQAQPQPPPQQAPTPAPPQPYKPVALTPPKPLEDPSFEAFRRQLAGIAQRKDRAALARLVVAQGFFWEKESGDAADKRKSGIDNLAAAIGLVKGPGWEMLAGIATIPTAEALSERKGVVCAPADPAYDENAFDELVTATRTEPFEWAYPLAAGLEVRAAARADAQVLERLDLHFVRVLPEEPPRGQNQPPAFLRIVTPSGRTGYVAIDALAPLADEQLCYVKDAAGWKIAGYIGEGPEQP
jgi:hypothetical protein